MKGWIFAIFVILIFIPFIRLSTPISIDYRVYHTKGQDTNFILNNHGLDGYSMFSNDLEILVRLYGEKETNDLLDGVEIVGKGAKGWIDVIIPQSRLIELSTSILNYSVIIEDVKDYDQQVAGHYHTLAETDQFLKDIADSYPNISKLYNIGKSFQNRDIWCLEITDDPGVDEGEPGVFFMGLQHAREWPSLEICLYIANRLTSAYDIDANITNIVDNRRIWILPCANPDGYYFCHDQDNDWRKNRHFFPEFGTYGVDLNRNYPGSCNGDEWGAWGSVGPASIGHNPILSTYCGPYAISEFETQAVYRMFIENNITALITWHTYGELVMWPWGYSTEKQTPDNTYLAQIGQQIASRITRQDGIGTYKPCQAANSYPTTGDTADWAYGYAHYILGKPTFAYTIESCSSYHPSKDVLEQVCKENYDGALYLLQEAENIPETVTPRILPPIISEPSSTLDSAYTISWEEQNPEAEPDYFQLDELTDYSFITDNVETATNLWKLSPKPWILDGFSITNSKFHSAGCSFKSPNKNKDASSMTTSFPLPVTEEMKLSFWCWYKIEKDYDYAFIEVSMNGRDYQILDTFTGSSSKWIYKEYDLADYVNLSIFIRFRYTTDAKTVEEGFYVDDVSPVPNFGSITTLSRMITNNYYTIKGKSEDIYYYRVRGYNTAHGWGDYSTLKKIQVGVEEHLSKPDTSLVFTTGISGFEHFHLTKITVLQGKNIFCFDD